MQLSNREDDGRTIVSKTVFVSNNSTSCPDADDATEVGADDSTSAHYSDTASSKSKTLNLMMISCEENPPYGPSKDTAMMFLELFCQAYKKKCSLREVMNIDREQQHECSLLADCSYYYLTIRISIYLAQSDDYPLTSSEWSSYDGILIPGSLSAAYDNTNVEWIEKLQSVIRNDIHRRRLKTMGVCFGHQCFAHAFGSSEDRIGKEGIIGGEREEGGRAIKCPTGSKAGRISSQLTHEGRQLLLLDGTASTNSDSEECSMELLYTHGDMVDSLPEFAISLGGNANVPIEACAYFSSKEDKVLFQKQLQQHQHQEHHVGDDDDGTNKDTSTVTSIKVQPYAFTFQAHPEYISPTGFNVNYINTVQAMEDRGYITQQVSKEACEDARVNFGKVREDSLEVVIAVATAFGWF